MTLLLRLLLLSLYGTILLQAATAYTDNDLDGVDDAVDLCPNTPFDVLVNEHGCDMNKRISGKLLLQAGTNINTDAYYDNSTLLNLYLDYSYRNWDISLSSANYNTTNLSTVVDAEDDLFLTVGYTIRSDKLVTKLSLGTKFAFLKEEGKERDNDYYASVNFDYTFNDKQNLFAFYSYTLSGDSKRVDYKNFHTVSVGTGYSITPEWYSSLSYNYASSYYEGAKAYRTLSWFNVYMLTSGTYLSFNYAYGINEEAYDHTFSFAIGAIFE
jgi:hypothetical protein